MAFPRSAALCLPVVLGALLLVSTVSGAQSLPPRQANSRAVELMRQGQFEQALGLLHDARRSLPYDEVVRGNLAECYLGLGLQHLQARRYAEAARVLREGREYDDDRPEFWLYRGLALLRQGDYGGAEVDLNEAVIMDEKSVLGHRLLGQAYYDSGRLYRAIEAWERAKALAPENAELDALLSKARRELEVEAPMRRDYGRNFVISYDGEIHPGLGDSVLEVLEDAYREIGYDLNYYPDTQIPVLLYTERDFSSLTDSPDWAGGLYDGKIRIPLGGVAAMNTKVRALLYHEYTHVAIHFLTRGRCPVWLNEGLAEVAERRYDDPPLDALRQALRNDVLLPFERLEGSFAGLPAEQVPLAYEQSYSLVRYMLENFHYYKMTELLGALGEGRSTGEAIAGALGQFGMRYGTLQEQWRRSIGESP